MNDQQLIEQNVRLTLGDLTLQLIIARAQQQMQQEEIAALKKAAAETQPPLKNGKAHSHAEADRPQPG